MTQNKSKLIFIGAVVLIIVSVVVIFLLINRPAKTKIANDVSGPPVSGLIDTNDALLNATTNKDFNL